MGSGKYEFRCWGGMDFRIEGELWNIFIIDNILILLQEIDIIVRKFNNLDFLQKFEHTYAILMGFSMLDYRPSRFFISPCCLFLPILYLLITHTSSWKYKLSQNYLNKPWNY